MKIRKVPVTRMDPLAHLGPFIGPCMICGGPDKRHRLADALVGNVLGGLQTIEETAASYEVPIKAVRGLMRDYKADK